MSDIFQRAKNRKIMWPYVVNTVIIAVLHFAFCLLEQARTSYSCEGSTMRITCPRGRVIQVTRANYGRLNLQTCNEGQPTDDWRTDCLSSRGLRVVDDLYVCCVEYFKYCSEIFCHAQGCQTSWTRWTFWTYCTHLYYWQTNVDVDDTILLQSVSRTKWQANQLAILTILLD